MAITLSDYPAIESPAACPKCGSMALTWPMQGRRTLLWLSICWDCGASIRSSEKFEILPRKALKYDPPKPEPPIRDSFQRLASARIAELNKLDPQLRQTREPGEDDDIE